MYKARSIRFLWLFCAICDSLMSCTIHFFWKKVIFHEIFQVGVCLNLKDSSFYDWFSIHVYKAWSNRYLLIFCSICDSLMLYKVHFVWKRWFFMKYFKLVHAPTWKIPHYMKVILFICTRQEAFCIFKFFSLSRTLLCLVRYIFWEKDDFFFMKYFKLVHAPTWKIPHYMTGFLSICTRHEAFGLFHCFALSATLLCLVWYIFLEKYHFFNEIFQVGACPNLKDSSLYDRFSIHMYKAWSVRFLWLFCAICDSLMPWTVYFFGKRWFFMKYFKLVHAPTWKIPHYMRGFLFICTRHEAFGIFNIFCAKFIKMYLFICTRHREFGISTFCAFCDYLTRCKVRDFGKKMIFFMKYFKLVHAPT